jgi:hypothetical protein
MHTGESLIPFVHPIVAATNARSTVILGSAAAVRATGRWDDYVAALAEPHRTAILSAVAGTWIPFDVAKVHYDACDALGFSADEMAANGRRTFDAVGGTLFGAVLRMAKTAGLTPWAFIEAAPRFWWRSYDGGGVQVEKLGPKEARVQIVAVDLLDSPYFRGALRGLLTGVLERFCTKAYVHEKRGPRRSSAVTLSLQWA